MTNKRIEWIDIIKGISIIMVVLGHLDYCPEFCDYFYEPFFLTTFLFCFGYTFNSEVGFKEFCKKRVKTLLIPLIIFSLFIIFSRYLFTLSEHQALSVELKRFILQIRGQGDDLWFIALMFISSFPFYFISKLEKKKIIYFITLAVCFFSSFIYYKYINIPLPWHLQIVGSAILYMGIGYYLKKENISLININKNFKGILWLLASIIIYITSIVISMKIFKNRSFTFYSYGNSLLLYTIISALGLAMVVSVSKYIGHSKIFSFLGKNTLLIFALHGKVERLVTVILNKVLHYMTINLDGIFINFCLAILATIITLLILVIPIKIINKYLPFLLGKKGGLVNEKN